MNELGWFEGRNITIEPRYGSDEQMRELAAELVRSKVDLIMTDSTPASLAAKEATATIPIVFLVAADPVAGGLVASLARPGGNLTGYVIGSYEEKMLETLKAALPRLSRVARPAGVLLLPDVRRAATGLGLELLGVEGLIPDRFELFLASARKAGADALLIPNIAGLNESLDRLGGAATSAHLPAIGPYAAFARGGGLLAYGPQLGQGWPRIAAQVDKILRGAKPADLPVEQPTRFTLTVNLKAAKALGLTIPQSLLLSADEIIQ
jgi:putative tryptophan/tyrosine transport system substrate-binding protein